MDEIDTDNERAFRSKLWFRYRGVCLPAHKLIQYRLLKVLVVSDIKRD